MLLRRLGVLLLRRWQHNQPNQEGTSRFTARYARYSPTTASRRPIALAPISISSASLSPPPEFAPGVELGLAEEDADVVCVEDVDALTVVRIQIELSRALSRL